MSEIRKGRFYFLTVSWLLGVLRILSLFILVMLLASRVFYNYITSCNKIPWRQAPKKVIIAITMYISCLLLLYYSKSTHRHTLFTVAMVSRICGARLLQLAVFLKKICYSL